MLERFHGEAFDAVNRQAQEAFVAGDQNALGVALKQMGVLAAVRKFTLEQLKAAGVPDIGAMRSVESAERIAALELHLVASQDKPTDGKRSQESERVKRAIIDELIELENGTRGHARSNAELSKDLGITERYLSRVLRGVPRDVRKARESQIRKQVQSKIKESQATRRDNSNKEG